jgi:hypothetical protein
VTLIALTAGPGSKTLQMKYASNAEAVFGEELKTALVLTNGSMKDISCTQVTAKAPARQSLPSSNLGRATEDTREHWVA